MQAVTCSAGDRYQEIITGYIEENNGAIGASASSELARSIICQSAQYGVQPLLMAALIKTESNFEFDAVSPAGAVGLTQLMPSTAAEIGFNPYIPTENIGGGAKYLSAQLKRFSDMGDYQVAYALAAYNAGPGAVEQAGGIPVYLETVDYVHRVIEEYRNLVQKYWEG